MYPCVHYFRNALSPRSMRSNKPRFTVSFCAVASCCFVTLLFASYGVSSCCMAWYMGVSVSLHVVASGRCLGVSGATSNLCKWSIWESFFSNCFVNNSTWLLSIEIISLSFALLARGSLQQDQKSHCLNVTACHYSQPYKLWCGSH